MRTFADNAGQTWTVAINVDALKRVRSLLSVDLLTVLDGPELLTRLTGDPVFLCDVVYAICKPEADQRGVTDEQFGRAMAGDAIDGATMALLEDLAGFFPKARRAVVQKVLTRLRAMEAKATAAVTRKLDSPAIEAELDKAIAQELGDLSGPAPASSD